MNEYAIETVGLTKKYRGFTLDGLTLSLPRGAVMGLIGENGAGKTTAIKALLDIVKRDSGSVTLLGRDADDDLKLTKEEIGVVFGQRSQLWWDIPVMESFELLQAIYAIPEPQYRGKLEELTELLGAENVVVK